MNCCFVKNKKTDEKQTKTINNIVGIKKAKRPKQVFKKKKLFFGLFTNGIVTLKQNKSKEQFISRSC